MLKVGDRIIFDVTGDNTVDPEKLKARLNAYDFLMWVRHDGCEAEVVQVIDKSSGHYNIEFEDTTILYGVSKIHFEDLIEEFIAEANPTGLAVAKDKRPVAIRILVKQHLDLISDDMDEAEGILKTGFPGYEKMSSVDLYTELSEQQLISRFEKLCELNEDELDDELNGRGDVEDEQD